MSEDAVGPIATITQNSIESSKKKKSNMRRLKDAFNTCTTEESKLKCKFAHESARDADLKNIFTMYTTDENINICYDVRKLENVQVGDKNPAYKLFDKQEAKKLRVHKRFSSKDVYRLQLHKTMCQNTLQQNFQRLEEVGEEAKQAVQLFGRQVIDTSKLETELSDSMFGHAWGWLKRITKKSIQFIWEKVKNNRLFINVCIAMYTLAKTCVCIFFAPGMGLEDVLLMLDNKFGYITKAFKTAAKLAKSMFCANPVTCFMNFLDVLWSGLDTSSGPFVNFIKYMFGFTGTNMQDMHYGSSSFSDYIIQTLNLSPDNFLAKTITEIN